MTIEQLTELFKWMTIINIGLFFLAFIATTMLQDMIFGIHAKLFGVPQEQIPAVYYSLFGYYKIAILMFNAVPYVALLMI